jgi:hypothetical protein
MKSPEQFANQEVSSPEITEKKHNERLDSLLDHARRVTNGELPPSESLYDDLTELGKTIYDGGDITSDEKLKIEEAQDKLPNAEIDFCLKRAEDFLAKGDTESARSWQDQAAEKITIYRDRGALDPKDVPVFTARSKEILSKSEKSKEAVEQESNQNKQEKTKDGELLSVEEQRSLFKHLLKEKIYGRGKNEKSRRRSISEQIARLAEGGKIQDASVDLLTGRIHLKYKPKSRSLLTRFLTWIANYDQNRIKKMMAESSGITGASKEALDRISARNFGGRDNGVRSGTVDTKENKIKPQQEPIEALRDLGVDIEGEGEDAIISFEQDSEEGKKAAEAFSDILREENSDLIESGLPTDSKSLNRYMKDTFKEYGGLPLEDFKKKFTEDDKDLFKEALEQYLRVMIHERITDKVSGRYPDTVASVLGNGDYLVGILQRIMAVEDGKVQDMNELLPQPFSKVAEKYLGIDALELDKEYFKHFSPR